MMTYRLQINCNLLDRNAERSIDMNHKKQSDIFLYKNTLDYDFSVIHIKIRWLSIKSRRVR